MSGDTFTFPHTQSSSCDHKTALACNKNLFLWVISLWATYLDFLSCLNKTHYRTYCNCRNYVWLRCLDSAPPRILKPISEIVFGKLFSPTSDLLSLFQFCSIKSKCSVLWVWFLACFVHNDNLFFSFGIASDNTVAFWENIVSVFSSAGLFPASACPAHCVIYGNFLIMHTVSLIFHQTFLHQRKIQLHLEEMSWASP